MANSPQAVRIFISSPGDVAEERDGARQVVEGLRRLYPGAELQAVLWEELPLPATASFQETIDFLLKKEPIDVAVFILWSRLGSPLGAAVTRADGTPYRSGTEREFDLMLAAFEQSGRKRPVILAYVRDDDAGFTAKLAKAAKLDRSDLIDQQQMLEAFVVEQFHDAEGRNVRAYQTYSEPVGFMQRLRVHLRRALDDLLEVEKFAIWTEDPYRGLEAFDTQHAPIFFGRDEESCEVLQRLRDREKAGCAFVVIVAASGSGKSSLARAGVAANLIHQGGEDGARWHVSSMIPTLRQGNLCDGLVHSLAGTLPDLINSEEAAERIAKGLTENAELTVELMIGPAFANAETPARLLIILDQMEELWTDRNTTDEERDHFLAAVSALAKSGHVSFLATLRSDFYPHAQRSPTFLKLKGERGHFDLLPPDGASIHRMITEPARLTGLSFERNETSGKSLDEVIWEDAASEADALPLLEYTLSELYQQRDQDRRLMTFAAYVELGGVDGAIGKRADEAFGSLPADAQAALNEILPLLVSVDVSGEQSAVRRRATVFDLTSTPARKTLTEQLIADRFLATDREGETPVASLAHEALLRSWDRIVSWINSNREHLRLRARVEQQQQRWEQQDRDNSLLLAEGLPLDEGRELFEQASYLLTDSTKEYIQASTVHQQRIEKRTRRTKSAAGLTLALLVTLFGLVYRRSQGRAAVAALLTADAQSVLDAAEIATAYRFWTEDELQRIAAADAETGEQRRRQRHARLALVPFDSSHVGSLLNDALTIQDTGYVGVIREALLKADVSIEEDCWSRFRNGGLSRKERFRAGVMLAGVVPESDKWTDTDFQLLVDELAAVNSVYQPQFWPLLQGVGDRMLPPLEALFSNRGRTDSEHIAAANAIGFFAEQDAQRLARLLQIASEPQYNVLYEKYREVANEQTRADFAESIQRQPTDDLDERSRIALGKERAASAITLLRQGQRESILDVLRYEDDPEALTQFVHRCRACGVTPSELMDLLEMVDQRRGPLDGERLKIDYHVMYALLLALGEFDWDDLPPTREALVERLGAIYETDPSSGVHSATGWLLRQWNQREAVDRVDQTPIDYDPTGHREWYVDEVRYKSGGTGGSFAQEKQMHFTFIVFQPREFTMGSPTKEPNHVVDETQHQVTLTRPIAVCDRELTWARWMAMEGTVRRDAYIKQFYKYLGDNDPVFGVSWYESVGYCRWLGEQAGVSEEEQCYEDPESLPKDGEDKPTDWPVHLHRVGFRLPTEAEWEFVCRSGTGTAYSFGHDVELLDRYGWFLKNSGDWSPTTAELRPNPRGLFDMYGSLYEWCHDWYNDGELSDETDPVGVETGSNRVYRGGSWHEPAKRCRSSYRNWFAPASRNNSLGFRLATVPPSRVPEAGESASVEDSAGR